VAFLTNAILKIWHLKTVKYVKKTYLTKAFKQAKANR
jgi:hypothetical protein